MKRTQNMPSWVYLGLWGIQSRRAALGYFIASLIVAIAIAVLSVLMQDYWLASIVLVPFWYWAAIKWGDNNALWPTKEDSAKA